MYGCRVCGLQCFMCLEHSSLSIVIRIRLFVHMAQSVDVEQLRFLRSCVAQPDRPKTPRTLNLQKNPYVLYQPEENGQPFTPVPIWSIDMKKAFLVVVLYHI